MSEITDRLEELGADVGPPPGGPGTSGRAERLYPGEPYGRLGRLAQWWRSCVPGAAAPLAPMEFGAAGTTPELSVDEAIEWAVEQVDQAVDGGVDLLLVQCADRTAARILAAYLIDLDPVDATGWPAAVGLSDEQWSVEVADLRDGLRRVSGLRGTPEPLLRALGSATVACCVAALLRGCARGVPALLDGPAVASAALLARRVAPSARDWWQLGSGAPDPLSTRVMNSLHLDPLTDLGVQVEDGTMALVALDLLRHAGALPPPEPAPDPDPEPEPEPEPEPTTERNETTEPDETTDLADPAEEAPESG